jgi:hypothetical protein
VRTRYVSTAGAAGAAQLRFVADTFAVLPRGCTLVDATDSDAGGEKLRAQLASVAGDLRMERAAPPVGKDWNDSVKHADPRLTWPKKFLGGPKVRVLRETADVLAVLG